MLDVLTLRYQLLSQPQHVSLIYVTILAGACLGAFLFRHDTYVLGRSAYVFGFGLAAAALAASQILWVCYLPALKIGISGVFLFVDFGGALLFGLFSIWIALGRARDGFGSNRYAALAFIPILGFGLVFRPSLTGQTQRFAPLLVLAGVGLFCAAQAILPDINKTVEQAARANLKDATVLAALRDLEIRANGVEAALDKQIAIEAAPQRVQPDLWLTAVNRAGREITYVYVLNQDGATSLDPGYRRAAHDNFCGAMMQYFKAGATAVILYTHPDGSKIEALHLSLAECTT